MPSKISSLVDKTLNAIKKLRRKAEKKTTRYKALQEIKRLEKAAKRASSRGFEFNLPFRYTKSGAEKKRFTKKDVEYLKSLKTEDLYRYSTYKGRSGVERRAEERREASLKAAKTRKESQKSFDFDARQAYEDYKSVTTTIINNFLDRTKFVKLNYSSDKYFANEAYDYVVSVIEKLKNDPNVGASKLAWALDEANKEGLVREIHLSYWWEIRMNMEKLSQYIPIDYADDFDIMDFSEDDSDTFPDNREKSEDAIMYFG